MNVASVILGTPTTTSLYLSNKKSGARDNKNKKIIEKSRHGGFEKENTKKRIDMNSSSIREAENTDCRDIFQRSPRILRDHNQFTNCLEFLSVLVLQVGLRRVGLNYEAAVREARSDSPASFLDIVINHEGDYIIY